MRLLCLSNGHGEDQIALRILEELRQLPHAPTIEVLPIVGDGGAYRKAQFDLIGPAQNMPSGGFINLDAGRQLARDIEAGLLKLTIGQIRTVKQWAKASPREQSLILSVGDIVPMLFAWCVNRPFAFVGTAKSEYYLRDETNWLQRASWWDDRLLRWTGCVYLPWERWLMRRQQCVAVFPRDTLTVNSLKQFAIPAFDVGNPMMDGIGLIGAPLSLTDAPLTIALIPGSRVPEIYDNWGLILESVKDLGNKLDRPVRLLAALVPACERPELLKPLQDWECVTDTHYRSGSGRHVIDLTLSVGKFVECIQQSHLAIAMAGTATEQFVGLGKPVVTLPGRGPQFVPAFAEAQTRLLGESVHLVQNPAQVAQEIQMLLAAPLSDWQAIAENGYRRMGRPGAAKRIANCLMQQFDHLPLEEM
ncbi:hypothetical protein IQ266_03855 [filamentous cyanobacterium LEGE 11480]|uniref:Lipid-A-disaccharide synthase n=1 Tax=Romeriopsis navalis LEGE 11480 TaxID=2777977 RepID=A0A928Z320_9CYAN|nr:lipid-A-disaccharide synthase-related protein [Romeriopsis navalis]MBE9028895.1 hypothetical protein [Romeriopsis navalis LEGE 11480]